MKRLAGAGDRMVIAVALVILAAVAAMGVFALVAAERIDSASRMRWVELVQESLARRAAYLQRDLSSFAHWDESVLRTAYFLDTDWVHKNFGSWLHTTQRHDQSFIVLGDQVGYASVDGALVPSEEAPFDAAAIMPLVRSVQTDYAESAARVAEKAGSALSPAAGSSAPDSTVEPIFRAAYLRVLGRAALVGAVSITPDYGRVISPSRTPPVALTVLFLEGPFLNDLMSELHLVRPRVVNAPTTGTELISVSIPFQKGVAPAWLEWVPENPGSALLRALMPALMGTAALLLAVAAVVLWYARRATQDLAESEALASRLAYVDPLCGLANRAMLMRVLGQRLTQAGAGRRLAILFVDLDGFKDINDTLGHHIGDLLLAEIGRRLHEEAGPSGLAARFGGDEFVIVAPVSGDDGEVAAMGARVLETIRRPVAVAGHTLMVGASIGATVAPDHGLAASELIRLADIAVYRAKSEGRGAFRLFEPEMEVEVRRRREVEVDLARALAEETLEVHYQPQFAVDSETVVGFEALVRWFHPTRGLVPPSEFVPVAEHTGLITALDMWVLRRACAEAKGWGKLKLAVNLSPVDFRSPDLAAAVSTILRETGFDPRRLEIEITENLLFGNQPEAFAALSALRAMGVRIALDDFGSGYSSLGYIRRFRVDTIKIDKSFTQNIAQTDDAPAIIDCVVRLARALGISVTAEGVETREQLRYLQSVGCHHVQGFLFGGPVPLDRIDQYLDRSIGRQGGGGSGPLRVAVRGYAGPRS